MDPIKIVMDALAEYLKGAIPGLQECVVGFPNPSQKLKLPSISLIRKPSGYRNDQPYEVSRVVDPDGINATVLYALGTHELKIQLDLWSSHKPKRAELTKAFLAAFHKDVLPAGLRLQVAGYHNEWIQFDMLGLQDEDEEVGSQTERWRTTVSVEANFRNLLPKMERIIKSIENTVEIVQTELEE